MAGIVGEMKYKRTMSATAEIAIEEYLRERGK